MNFPRSNPSVRYRNYYYTQKTAGKVSAEKDEEYDNHIILTVKKMMMNQQLVKLL